MNSNKYTANGPSTLVRASLIKYDIRTNLAKRRFREKKPPTGTLQTNNVVGPPTIQVEMFRFKLVFGF